MKSSIKKRIVFLFVISFLIINQLVSFQENPFLQNVSAQTTDIAVQFEFPVDYDTYSVTGNEFLEPLFDANGRLYYHPGEDWNYPCAAGCDCDRGLPVYAIANGLVTYADNSGEGFGNVVLLEHTLRDGSTIWSQYAHLDRIDVTENANVLLGQQIGTIGDTGGDYCAHLHFEIRIHNISPYAWNDYVYDRDAVYDNYVDPTDFLIYSEITSGVAIFEDSFYRGNRVEIQSAGLFDLPDFMNDKASSIAIPKNWTVHVYKHSGQGGNDNESRTFYWNDLDFSNDTFEDGSPLNDNISSVQIETHIEKGLNYLRERHAYYANNSWSNSVGITALATLAFLNNGIDESDFDVHSAIQYILSNQHEDGSIYVDYSSQNYETSLALLAIKATQNDDYAPVIAAARDWLIRTQWDDDCAWGSIDENSWYWGGFGYGTYSRPDMSNSQFSLLALDAANLSKTDSTWTKAIKFVSRSQNRQASNDGLSPYDDGGFIYIPGIGGCLSPGCTSYGSATGAGIWGLALAGLTPQDYRFAAALTWVENNYSWNYNPLTNGSWGNNSLYYYYLSMSKALSMARKTRIGDHDWYRELSEKLRNLQNDDGSWVNLNGWLYENVPELATSYAILALQTRQLPPNRDLEMVIILHSPADIHLYDTSGRHVGKNYATGGIDLEIPGASYSVDNPQAISIKPPVAGNYHVELVGTGDGDWQLEIIGNQDGKQVSYDSYSGSITSGTILATDLNVGAFEGGLTIFSSEPAPAPVMSVNPSSLSLSGHPGDTLTSSFSVLETGGGANIQSIGIFASDLNDEMGNSIPGARLTFNPTSFDLSANGNQLVQVTIPIPPDQQSGNYVGTITIESLNAGTKTIQIEIEVTSNLPPSLTIPTEVTVQYSDFLTFNVTATDPNDAGDTLTLTIVDLPESLSFTDNGDGTATISGMMTDAPGTYDVGITVTDPGGLSDTGTVPINVSKEDARATYTGPMLVSTGCADCSFATIPIRATMQDISAVMSDPAHDDYPGDITHATVTFVNRQGNTDICSANIVLFDPTDPTSGSASCDWLVDIGNSDGEDYTIGIVVDGYYTRDSAEDAAVVVVSKPTSNFITGGGYLVNQNSGGVYAGDNGLKTNFGLNVKFNKKLTNLQGKVTILVRQGGHVYKIKSNTLSSLVVVPFIEGDMDSGNAELIGKASIEDVTDPLNPISLGGNATMQVTMKDNGDPGSSDLIGISIWNKDGELLFSNNWNGVETFEQVLDGGNLQVH